jgi:hypothetical protein
MKDVGVVVTGLMITGRLELVEPVEVVGVLLVGVVAVAAAENVTATVPPALRLQRTGTPLQPSPLQEPIVNPEPGVAFSVTTVPIANVAEHIEGHEIPLGELVTLPDPLVVTARLYVVGAVRIGVVMIGPVMMLRSLKPAVTSAAVSVTVVPLTNDAEHVEPQLIPPGLLETLPGPVTVTDTVNGRKRTGIVVLIGGTVACPAGAPPAEPGRSTNAVRAPSAASTPSRSTTAARLRPVSSRP